MTDSADKIKIVVAETSPIICAGTVMSLRRIESCDFIVMEAHNYEDLRSCIISTHPDAIIVNPNFIPGFLPAGIRNDTGHNCPVIAIETGQYDKTVLDLYDGSISIVDDMDTLSGKILSVVAPQDGSAQENETGRDHDTLSTREKEIVTYVVKGFTNKEIAERLFLSVHTVVTHRRNIARKLDIHSPTGLTIYAIVNKLVDLSEINI